MTSRQPDGEINVESFGQRESPFTDGSCGLLAFVHFSAHAIAILPPESDRDGKDRAAALGWSLSCGSGKA
jgi:hypothetical protein